MVGGVHDFHFFYHSIYVIMLNIIYIDPKRFGKNLFCQGIAFPELRFQLCWTKLTTKNGTNVTTVANAPHGDVL